MATVRPAALYCPNRAGQQLASASGGGLQTTPSISAHNSGRNGGGCSQPKCLTSHLTSPGTSPSGAHKAAAWHCQRLTPKAPAIYAPAAPSCLALPEAHSQGSANLCRHSFQGGARVQQTSGFRSEGSSCLALPEAHSQGSGSKKPTAHGVVARPGHEPPTAWW